MTIQTFCSRCGAQRSGEAAFCGACGAGFEATPASQPNLQQGLADGMLELEKMRMKLIVGRLVGIAIGLAIWWLVIGPTFGDNPLIVGVGLVVALFGGLYVGQFVMLNLVKK